MGRSKILNATTNKMTFDLSGSNRAALEQLSAFWGTKLGPALNRFIDMILNMDEEMLGVFTETCKEQCQLLDAQIEAADGYAKRDLIARRERYYCIATMINKCQDIDVRESTASASTMTKYTLQDGYLVCPSDWIVLNPEEALTCRYAGVVECKNHAALGIPHFVYFTEYKYGCDYTDALEKRVFKMCEKAWPKFRDVIAQQVTLIRDPEDSGRFLNKKEYDTCPIIGMFHIDESNASTEHPFGAMLVRTIG